MTKILENYAIHSAKLLYKNTGGVPEIFYHEGHEEHEEGCGMNRVNNTCRFLGTLAVLLLVTGGVAWYGGLVRRPESFSPANSIMVLMPYRVAGTWVFDDPSVGLRQEPFVAGIPEMIDEMVKDIPDAAQGFRLLFSGQPFP